MTFDERWDNSKWPRAADGSRYGTMIDPKLAESGIDFKGGVAILNIGVVGKLLGESSLSTEPVRIASLILLIRNRGL